MDHSAVIGESFEQIKGRLDKIVDAVSAEDLSLDEALELYEEAVQLGMRASELIEQDTRPQGSRGTSDESANS